MHEHLMSNLTMHNSLMVDDKLEAIRNEVEGKISELKCEKRDELHENSEALSSATNPKPKGLPSYCLLRQA